MDEMELIRLLRRAAAASRRPVGEEGFSGERREDREPGGPRGPHDHGPRGHHGPHGCGGPGPWGGPPPMPHRERERVLTLLDETEGVSQQRLALILGIRPQSLSELLGKLEKDGLLLREKNPEDRRETLVSLTTAGKERAGEYEAARRRAGEAFFARLTEEERQTLGCLLEKLLEDREEESM